MHARIAAEHFHGNMMSDSSLKRRACRTDVRNGSSDNSHQGKLIQANLKLILISSCRPERTFCRPDCSPNVQTCAWNPCRSGFRAAGRRCGEIVMLAKGGKKKKKPGTVAENKQARFNYQIDQKFECGRLLRLQVHIVALLSFGKCLSRGKSLCKCTS